MRACSPGCKLPHQRGSAAISLVERQVLVLREKHGTLERKLHELIENGRANDAIVDRCHRLTRRLLRARDLAGTSLALDTSLREDFGASRWLIAAHESRRAADRRAARTHTFASCRAAAPSSGSSRRSSRTRARAAARSATPSANTCSAPRKAPWARWCMIPLGEHAALGLLAIASNDTQRYLPTMSTDFLVRIGEIVSEALLARAA